MHNLTPCFLEAKGRAATWSEGSVHRALGLIADSVRNARVNWELGDEGLGAVLSIDDVIAYVWADGPLVIVLRKYEDEVRRMLENEGLVVVLANDTQSEEYCFDHSMTELVFPGFEWHDCEVDPRAFCISDLFVCLA